MTSAVRYCDGVRKNVRGSVSTAAVQTYQHRLEVQRHSPHARRGEHHRKVKAVIYMSVCHVNVAENICALGAAQTSEILCPLCHVLSQKSEYTHQHNNPQAKQTYAQCIEAWGPQRRVLS